MLEYWALFLMSSSFLNQWKFCLQSHTHWHWIINGLTTQNPPKQSPPPPLFPSHQTVLPTSALMEEAKTDDWFLMPQCWGSEHVITSKPDQMGIIMCTCIPNETNMILIKLTFCCKFWPHLFVRVSKLSNVIWICLTMLLLCFVTF